MIAEAVNMVAAQVIGNDATIAVAAINGNLELNVMMPVIAHAAAREHRDLAPTRPRVRREVRARHRGQRRALPQLRGAQRRAGHRDRARDRLRRRRCQDPLDDVQVAGEILDAKAVSPDRLDELLDLLKLTRGGRA